MLMQKIRAWASGWVASVILGVIIVTFAVWGINFSGQDIRLIAASVNGEDIELQRFQQAYANSLEQRRQNTDIPLTTEQEEQLKKDIIDGLVRNEVIYQAAASHGVYISDEQVRAVIEGIETFNIDDEFDLGIYRNIVTRIGMSPAVFEAQIRAELTARQLQSSVRDSVFVPQKEASFLTKINKQKRQLAYILLSTDEIKDSVEIDDDAIRHFYDGTTQGLLSSEQIKVAYLELSVDKLAEELVADEEAISIYYDENKDKYDEEEQRKLNIIDIKIPADTTDEEMTVMTTKAEKIRALIESGTSFADISEQYNDDSTLEILVTEHGYLAKGVLPEHIDEMLFSMDEDELSAVKRQANNLYILQLTGVKGGIKNTLEYVKEDVVKDYKRAEAEYQYFDLADKLVTLAYEHSDTLEVAAEIIGLNVQETDFFSRENAPDLLVDPKILSVAFNDDVIESKENTEAIELNNDQLIVMQVLDHLPAEKKSLDDVREQIIQTMKSEEAMAKQRQKGQDILEQLRQGIDLTKIAEAFGFEWQQVEAVERDDVMVNRQILRTAFKLGQPDEGGIVFGSTDVGKEGYAVVVVSGIVPADTLTDEDINSSKTKILQARVNAEWSAMLKEFMDQASISINSTNL